jgi:hypothetical protein
MWEEGLVNIKNTNEAVRFIEPGLIKLDKRKRELKNTKKRAPIGALSIIILT